MYGSSSRRGSTVFPTPHPISTIVKCSHCSPSPPSTTDKASAEPFPLEEYKNWWTTNAPNFVKEHSLEKILKFTGFPCIGEVSNLLDLKLILKESTLIFESINIKKIPVRPGEKFHESLISEEELRNNYEINDYYVIVDKQINQDTFSKWDCLEETKRTEQYSS
jgi:hypothetical protein